VLDWSGQPLRQITRVVAGLESTCALLVNGEVWCWGINPQGDPWGVPDKIQVPVSAKALDHGCLLGEDGGIYCWSATGASAGVAKREQESSTFLGVFAHESMRCGIYSDASVSQGVGCWGTTYFGEFANGADSATSDALLSISFNGKSIQGIHGGSLGIPLPYATPHACVVAGDGKTNGTISCWGSNQYKEVEDSDAVVVPALRYALLGIQAAPGGHHTCARLASLSTTDNVMCWGRNDFGQLGTGTVGSPLTTPGIVPGLKNASWVAAGRFHSCAGAAGALWCNRPRL